MGSLRVILTDALNGIFASGVLKQGKGKLFGVLSIAKEGFVYIFWSFIHNESI